MKLITVSLSLAIAMASLGVSATEITVKANTKIQDAVAKAQDGDTILVEPGTYHETVYIDKQNITLKSVKKAGAILDGQNKLNDGIIASGHGSIIDGFMVKGYKGNGIMTQGANNFKIINNVVGGAFYSIFPQFGKNGLIQGNEIYGSEDAGIYVGMSDNIDVIENDAHDNVIGIELENTRNALMARNKAYNNSAGLMLNLVPGLPVKDTNKLYIIDNEVYDNNLKNFAPASSIAASVEPGIGILSTGVDDAVIEGNTMRNNESAAIVIVDNVAFGMADDPMVEPYPDNIHVMKNTFINNGENPHGGMAEFIAATGRKGFELVTTGKGKGNCIAEQEGLDALGTKRWGKCDPSMSKADLKTVMLDKPVPSPAYTPEQRGRLTYLAVCTGCHTYNGVLHGPSMQSIQALYGKDTEALAKFIANPTRKRTDFAEMPPQAYLGKDTINSIANYILHDLKQ